MSGAQSLGMEQHTIYQIPISERHGKPRDLFTIWFGSNIMMLTIVTGAVATTVFKLGLLSAFIGIILGNLVGAIFMALHAAQGPQLGVPQMVQTRGQFGSLGAIAVIAIVVVMYMGFFASNLVLSGQSIHSIAGFASEPLWVAVMAIVSAVAAIFGHDLIHRYTRIMAWLSGVSLALAFCWICLVHGLPADILARGTFTIAGFLGAVSIAALWQIAYAPYVSDYSRYLPPRTGTRPAFWASYWGCVLGSVFPMLLGGILGLMAPGSEVVLTLTSLLGPLALIVIPVFSIGIAATNAMNLYCGVLSTITIIQTFAPAWQAGSRARLILSFLMTALTFSVAIFASANFLSSYTNFVLLLLYVLVPWTAINLVDYYLVKHGEYDVPSFFRPDGGLYGRFNWIALGCYAAGILIEIPFIASDMYVGPIARHLGGVDLSWIVGLALVSPIYWAMSKWSAGRSTPQIKITAR